MDLLCGERLGAVDEEAGLAVASVVAPTADRDAVIFEDLRVLQNLLELESVYVPPCNYFVVVQKDIQPYMRKVVSTWMLEVCEEQQCEDQVFPLAVNFLDRFLCACAISRRQLQLVAAVCLLLASKIRQCHALGVDLLCFYSDHSILPDELRRWELLVLSKLQWNVTAVTGFDYVDHVLERVSWTRGSACSSTVRRHAHTLVALCYTEPELIQTAPSLIATASICAAVRGLNMPWACSAVAKACQLTRVSLSAAERVVLHIEELVANEAAALVGGGAGGASATPASPSAATPANPSVAAMPQTCAQAAAAAASCSYGMMVACPGTDDPRHPDTPTDVTDVHF